MLMTRFPCLNWPVPDTATWRPAAAFTPPVHSSEPFTMLFSHTIHSPSDLNSQFRYCAGGRSAVTQPAVCFGALGTTTAPLVAHAGMVVGLATGHLPRRRRADQPADRRD